MFTITSKLSLNDVLDIECNVLEKRMRMNGEDGYTFPS